MSEGKFIDHGKDIDYNVDMDIRDEEAKLIEVVETERIKKSLIKPIRVVQSKKSNRACLFYNLEIENDPEFGTIYFCVVVGVLSDGKGKMETAYETTYMKTGTVLFDKSKENGGKK